MGSWRGTCMISRMGIDEGERVVVYLLTEKENKLKEGAGGFTHTTGLYKPSSVGIRGVYDGYGNISVKDKAIGELVYREVERELSKREPMIGGPGDRKRPEQGVSESLEGREYKPENIDDLLYYVERGMIEGYSMVMIKEEIHDRLIGEIGQRVVYEKGLVDDVIKGILRDVKKKEKTRIEEIEQEIEEEGLEGVEAEIARIVRQGYIEHDSWVVGNLERWGLKGYIKKYMETEGKETEDIEKCLKELILLDKVIDLIRGQWVPQNGAGSQSSEYKLYEMIADYTKEEIARVEKEYAEGIVEEYREEYRLDKRETIWF